MRTFLHIDGSFCYTNLLSGAWPLLETAKGGKRGGGRRSHVCIENHLTPLHVAPRTATHTTVSGSTSTSTLTATLTGCVFRHTLPGTALTPGRKSGVSLGQSDWSALFPVRHQAKDWSGCNGGGAGQCARTINSLLKQREMVSKRGTVACYTTISLEGCRRKRNVATANDRRLLVPQKLQV